jgi:hypothetical protein
MYTTRFSFSESSIDPKNQRLFAPFCGALNIHTIELNINGVIGDGFFVIQHPWIVIDQAKLGYPVENTDNISVRIEYFYKSANIAVLDFLVTNEYPSATRTKTVEIISKHYIDGFFALDNGLYKEAVLNFGTVLEGILNHTLKFKKLNELIKQEKSVNTPSAHPVKALMLEIKDLRNRVHPEQISAFGDVSREEAQKAKYNIQEIILFYKDKTVHY